MILNEKQKLAISESNWRILKKEFEDLKTYPEKLIWWDEKIPIPIQNHTDPNDPNHKIITNNYPVAFQYSGDGAPEVENSVASVFFYNKDNISVRTQVTKEFISILPVPFDNDQKQQFWDWFTEKIQLKTTDDWINHYTNELKIDAVHQPEIIGKLKSNLKTECDNNLGNGFFEVGRNYGIHKNSKYLKIGDPDLDFVTIVSNVKDLVKGYTVALKETALGNVVKSLETGTIEPIEDIPTDLQQRICWLYAIGVIDSLFEKHKITSNSTMGRILSKGTGINHNTIKVYLDRIQKEGLLNKYDDYINNTCKALKINRIKIE